MQLRPVVPADDIRISILLDEVFEGPMMWQFVKTLRRMNDVALERIAEVEGKAVGYICFSRNAAPQDWCTLSVVAVAPSYQREGRGRQLIHMGLADAKRIGVKAVTVMGVPEYFQRVGFSAPAARNLELPFGKGQVSLYPIAAGTGLAKTAVAFSAAYDTAISG
ncbi:Acetyltransferase (GNAT) family protein [Aquimixticola soesokkakensis]|uniref:Acetyltransferase (GNAT) family protein n=1 Tax=Aquimixticola soesokkakensis TaxID=1519096 RepID=A0A1Y5RM71_9RHOB|nr:N-acetyltransferase [Aquimixticola soesokkakensis]SLN20579.1 Acetyltransferase (GNAT) family protein [Aquimixticola soesokkakensis]